MRLDFGLGRTVQVLHSFVEQRHFDACVLLLFRRISSRDEEEYADRILSAMRQKFGGHAIKREDG